MSEQEQPEQDQMVEEQPVPAPPVTEQSVQVEAAQAEEKAQMEARTEDKEQAVTRPAKLVTNTVEGRPLEVAVDERGLERAIRRLKRKIDTEGVTRELKRRRHYEKPSVRKRRKAREAERRRRRRDRRMLRK